METVLDVETTFQIIDKKKKPSPYLTDNFLVSVGLYNPKLDYYKILQHNIVQLTEEELITERVVIQTILNNTTLLIAHNAKFDLSWMYECGFTYNGPVWDTMICEYVLARGQKPELSLEATAIRRNLANKKSDLTKEYLNNGVGFNQMPPEIVVEYGKQDLLTTWDLYKAQKEELNKPENKGLMPTVIMMNEFCRTLIDMERNGIAIDLEELAKLKKNYEQELADISDTLDRMVKEVMGDYPYNLNSPEDLSKIIYSRTPKDKKQWVELFGIGTDQRGSVKKRKKPRRMSDTEFVRNVRDNTETIKLLYAKKCSSNCSSGRAHRIKKDGSLFKKPSICGTCNGKGFEYSTDTPPRVAGLKFVPRSSNFVTEGGFATSREFLEELLYTTNGNGRGKEFIELVIRHSAISSYLSSFIANVERGITYKNGIAILHSSFMQCVSATGRLTSQEPNFQNLPRGNTTPIRGVVTSRFKKVEKRSREEIQNLYREYTNFVQSRSYELQDYFSTRINNFGADSSCTTLCGASVQEGGVILEADYRALEYRCAVDQAKDKAGLHDILNGVDAHRFTVSKLAEGGETVSRQDAKPHTFKPLYGGSTGTPAQQHYYREFMKKHAQISEWQRRLQNEAIKTKKIIIPSGREYAFPNAIRLQNGNAKGKTQIVNYPVQGFATADIVPCAVIEIWKVFRMLELKSVVFLTVHDSIEIDVYPGEFELVATILATEMINIDKVLMDRYEYKTMVPFEVELKFGNNWRDTKELKHG